MCASHGQSRDGLGPSLIIKQKGISEAGQHGDSCVCTMTPSLNGSQQFNYFGRGKVVIEEALPEFVQFRIVHCPVEEPQRQRLRILLTCITTVTCMGEDLWATIHCFLEGP